MTVKEEYIDTMVNIQGWGVSLMAIGTEEEENKYLMIGLERRKKIYREIGDVYLFHLDKHSNHSPWAGFQKK